MNISERNTQKYSGMVNKQQNLICYFQENKQTKHFHSNLHLMIENE